MNSVSAFLLDPKMKVNDRVWQLVPESSPMKCMPSVLPVGNKNFKGGVWNFLESLRDLENSTFYTRWAKQGASVATIRRQGTLFLSFQQNLPYGFVGQQSLWGPTMSKHRLNAEVLTTNLFLGPWKLDMCLPSCQ